MSASDTFTGRLLGYHDIQVEGGSLLPRRNVVNFANALVEDVAGVTRVTLVQRPVWLASAVVSLGTDDYGPAGFASATDIPLTSAAAASVTGFASAGLVTYEKRVWNRNVAGTYTITIPHNDEDSAAENRVYCSGYSDMDINPGYGARLVWDTTSNHWWASLCLS